MLTIPAPAILLLEDEPDDRLLTRLVLSAGRIANPIIECETAERARREVTSASRALALCVVDIQLPGGESGLDWLRWLRRQPGDAARVPVVILTGFKPAERQERDIEAAAFRSLTKPVAPEALLDAVHQLGVLIRRRANGDIEFQIPQIPRRAH